MLLRFVFVEGDSVDGTWGMLEYWTKDDDRATLVLCDTDKPKYGSIVHPERFQALAQVFNAALDAAALWFWSDYVLFLPSDIHYEPDMLKRLLAADKDIIAPFSWTHEDGRYRFYDTWGFSYKGRNFTPFCQETAAVAYGDQPIELDTVGGTVLIRADVLRAGCRYTAQDVDRGLCWDAQRLGFTVWADPTTHVYHPPFGPGLLKEDHGIADVYSRDAERVKAAIQEKYGFTPPDAYVKDFIDFVSEFAS